MSPGAVIRLDAAAQLVDELPLAVALFDRECRYMAASGPWRQAFGLAGVALAGRRHAEVSAYGGAELDDAQRCVLDHGAVEDRVVSMTGLMPEGRAAVLTVRPHRGPDGEVARVVVTLMAGMPSGRSTWDDRHRDPITGLTGRGEFVERLAAALTEAEPAQEAALVVLIGIANLRDIENLHGRGVAGQVLKIGAERLVAGTRSRAAGDGPRAARQPDLVAHFGGGEFAVLCGGPSLGPDGGEKVAARLLGVLQAPIAIDELSLRLAANIGFVLPSHGSDAEDVLRDGEVALAAARARGPGRAVPWQPSLTIAATRQSSLAEQLRHAFDNGEFLLHYQPVLRLDDGGMVGAEALLRWNHPSEGMVPAAAFVPILDEIGLIDEVGCWTLREAVHQLNRWHVLYGRDIVEWVSVNLSPRQLHDPAALIATLRSIDGDGSPVHRLKLEITETALTQKAASADRLLAAIRALGVGLAIDHFGSAQASGAALRLGPGDIVKLDAGFVAQIGTAEGDTLVQGLLGLARRCGAAVGAEGIETAIQRAFLRDSGCSFGQGYLLAEPMDGAIFGAYALTHATTAAHGPSRRMPAPVILPSSADRSRTG